ncbi:MAG: ABC transporter ATP-binding protein [Ferrimicrobium sp.]
MGEQQILDIDDINVAYGPMRVLWGLSLSVQPAETLVVLGANGAGKSTLLKAVIGLLPLESGSITMLGQRVERFNAAKRIRLGVGYMSEQGIFPGLSVTENLKLGGLRLSRRELSSRLDEAFERFAELRTYRRTMAGSLSGGQRKLVGIAKCLMGHPSLLLMDEPSSGLSPRYVAEVVDQLVELRGTTTLVIAEQNVSFLDAADRVCVIEGGRTRFQGAVTDFESDAALHEAFFGLEGV